MNNKEAIAAINKLEEIVKPFTAMKDVLAVVEVSERQAKDLELRKEKANAELRDLDARIKAKANEFDLLKISCEKQIETAKTTSNEIIAKARASAQQIVAVANVDADKAKLDVMNKRDDLKKASDELNTVRTSIAQAKCDLRDVLTQRDDILVSLKKLAKNAGF